MASTQAEAGASGDRIAVMDAALADQIAAGEVVERPASVVKELVENAVDAGATRIDVRLEAGGKTLIRVLDDGRGIVPGELELALRRHATSKIRRADELVELATLGFRGEALASIAAVARVNLRSRRAGTDKGWEIQRAPADVATQVEERPVGMAEGTEVRIEHLFANVPARRKFLRSEATEVGHCVDAVLKTALVNPGVRFSLFHGARELLKFSSGDVHERVAQVLGRRGQGPYLHVDQELEGVRVRGWFAAPEQASRQRGGGFVVVRRRVVKEQSVSKVVSQAYALGEARSQLPNGHHAVYCLWIDPAPGTVDVNVHPQKSEVRFSEPQRVYSVLRRVLATAFAEAPWRDRRERARDAEGGERGSAVSDSLRAWDARAGERHAPAGGRSVGQSYAAPAGSSNYRLGTRASGPDYAQQKIEVRSQVADLATRMKQGGAEPRRDESDDTTPATAEGAPQGPSYLGVLPGPVALFMLGAELWAVDLRRLRGFLLLSRLRREMGGSGVVAQGLLPSITVPRPAEEVALVARRAQDLRELGLEVDPFGEEALIVRAVPAAMDHCRDEAGVSELLDQTLPWLRLREQQAQVDAGAVSGGLAAMASVRGHDPTPRYARRWLADALELAPIDKLPGVERWSPAQLLRRRDI